MAWHRCDECGKKFAFQKSLIEHQVQAKHNPASTGRNSSAGLSQQAIRHPEVLRCKQCSYEAVGSTADLELHIRLQHANGSQNGTSTGRNSKSNNSVYKCNKCRKTFNSLPALIRHKEILHPSEEEYALQLKPTRNTNFPKSKSGLKCRLCGKAFLTPFSLEQHLVKKHRSPSAASCSGSVSGGSGPATSPDSCTGSGPSIASTSHLTSPTDDLVSTRTTLRSASASLAGEDRRRLLEHHRNGTPLVSQNYGPALMNKAREFPVIYRVKNFEIGRSLVIIRVTSH